MFSMKETVEEYRKQGFVVDENNRVLCATSRMYARYSALGKVFQQERDSKGKLVNYVWTLIKKDEAIKLKSLLCPEDNKPAIKFAYIPASKIPQFNTSLPTVENEVEEVSGELFVQKKLAKAGADIVTVDEDLTPPVVTESDTTEPDDDLDDAFDELETETSNQETEETTEDNKGLSAREIEEKELLEKDPTELRKLCDDLGIEYAKNSTKKTLVNKILG